MNCHEFVRGSQRGKIIKGKLQFGLCVWGVSRDLSIEDLEGVPSFT